ncbi:MAG: iron deficiency-induced protein [Firmicutes bacterium]|nr:iron deficiency-induced protein [Bacillota bacterium]
MKQRALLSTMLTALVTTGLLAGCAAEPKPTQGGKEPTVANVRNQVVNVYSARNYPVDERLYAQFTKQTGIRVNVLKGNAEELIERLKREGQSSPADLFVTVDAGVLNNAREHGVLQPLAATAIAQNVPWRFRDKEDYWVGLATRARVIAYAKARVRPDQLATYEDLASERWQGKVLVPSSTSLYNQSLVASLIQVDGEQAATAWVQGIVRNMSRKPEGGDRDQVRAIAAGAGDVALINTYYYGQMLHARDQEEVKAAQQVGIIFPNQQTTGTHVNISGVGLTKAAKNKANAIKLIEFLTAPDAQALIAQENGEFPVNPKAEQPELLKSWGAFKAQQIDFAQLGADNKQALEILTAAQWQ